MTVYPIFYLKTIVPEDFFFLYLHNEYVRKNKLMHDNKIGISLPNEYNRLSFSINERILIFLCSILAFIFVMSIFNIRK